MAFRRHTCTKGKKEEDNFEVLLLDPRVLSFPKARLLGRSVTLTSSAIWRMRTLSALSSSGESSGSAGVSGEKMRTRESVGKSSKVNKEKNE